MPRGSSVISSASSVSSMERWGIPGSNAAAATASQAPEIALLERLVWVRYQSHWWPALLYHDYSELQHHLYDQLDMVLKAQFAMAIMRQDPRRQVKVARLLGRSVLEVTEVDEDSYCEFYYQLSKILPKATDIRRYKDMDLFFDFHRAMDQVEDIIQDVAAEKSFSLMPNMDDKTWIERAHQSYERHTGATADDESSSHNLLNPLTTTTTTTTDDDSPLAAIERSRKMRQEAAQNRNRPKKVIDGMGALEAKKSMRKKGLDDYSEDTPVVHNLKQSRSRGLVLGGATAATQATSLKQAKDIWKDVWVQMNSSKEEGEDRDIDKSDSMLTETRSARKECRKVEVLLDPTALTGSYDNIDAEPEEQREDIAGGGGEPSQHSTGRSSSIVGKSTSSPPSPEKRRGDLAEVSIREDKVRSVSNTTATTQDDSNDWSFWSCACGVTE